MEISGISMTIYILFYIYFFRACLFYLYLDLCYNLLQITIRSADIHKARFSKGTKIKFRVYKDEEYSETKMMKGTLSPEFKFSKVFSFPAITQEHIDFFDSGCITFLLYGLQEDTGTDSKMNKMTTKVFRFFLKRYLSSFMGNSITNY